MKKVDSVIDKKINHKIPWFQRSIIATERMRITKIFHEKMDRILCGIASDLEICEKRISQNDLKKAKDTFSRLKKSLSGSILEVREFIYMLKVKSSNESNFLTSMCGRSLAQLQRLMMEERNRMAQELHDTTLQKLATLLVGVQLCERLLSQDIRKVRMQIANLRNLALDTHQEIAKFPHERNIEQNFLLIPALREHLMTLQSISNTPVEFRIKGEEDGIPPTIKINLFKIIKEALTNVEKHAKASKVEIDLNMAGDQISATVADNGRGFDLTASIAKSKISGHLGLTWMGEQVRALGGTLTIDTNPWKGTRIIVDIPNSHIS